VYPPTRIWHLFLLNALTIVAEFIGVSLALSHLGFSAIEIGSRGPLAALRL